MNLHAVSDELSAGGDYRFNLHLVDGRIGQTQPATPVPQHRVGFPQRLNQLQEFFFFSYLGNRGAICAKFGQLGQQRFMLWQELV